MPKRRPVAFWLCSPSGARKWSGPFERPCHRPSHRSLLRKQSPVPASPSPRIWSKCALGVALASFLPILGVSFRENARFAFSLTHPSCRMVVHCRDHRSLRELPTATDFACSPSRGSQLKSPRQSPRAF